MVSREVLKNFHKLFYNIYQDLSASEIFREILSQQDELNYFHIFLFLDINHKNFIDEYDIYAFFKYFMRNLENFPSFLT